MPPPSDLDGSSAGFLSVSVYPYTGLAEAAKFKAEMRLTAIFSTCEDDRPRDITPKPT